MISLVNPERSFETPRLILEPLILSHSSALFEQLRDSELYTFIPNDPPQTLDELEKRFAFLSSRVSPDKEEAWLNWAMKLKERDFYVGRLEATVKKDKTASIAYMVFSKFWRNGYAKEGCQCILNHLIADYKITSISTEIDTRNIASIRLVESLGFQRISFKPNADFFKGSSSDEYLYEFKPE